MFHQEVRRGRGSDQNKNRGLTAMFEQPCQRGHLPLNPGTLTIENKPVKGNKPATVNIAASLPDELNLFYACFEAHNTAHTESAPAAVAEEVSAISISVADVTRSFKWVNIHKAVGPDGIPGCVLRACAFQLAGVFIDIFNLSLSLSVVPLCFKKSTIVPILKKIKSHA